jgi:hypothetical protein
VKFAFAQRRSLFVACLIAALALSAGGARAGIVMSTGIRYVAGSAPVSQCSTKAQTALDAFLGNATESPPGSGDWIATGPVGGIGPVTASAVVRCSPVGDGYVVTFTCAVQTPENPFTADALCIDVARAFSGQPTTPLPTPTPVPTGCTTSTLAGTWTSDSDSSVVLKLDPDGTLTDNQGVSGNWGLYGNTVTLTYYGTKTLTLSKDGKHMSGSRASYTRKC